METGAGYFGNHVALNTEAPHTPPRENEEARLRNEFSADEFMLGLDDPFLWPTVWDPSQELELTQFDGYRDTPPQAQGSTSFTRSEISNTRPLPPHQHAQIFLPPSTEGPIPNTPNCACLPNMYTTLSSFQTLPLPSFPLTLGLLSKSTTLARSVIHCQECIKTHVSAFQNVMLLSTLLGLIINEFSRLLAHIQDRAAKEELITLRLGEPSSPQTMHLHTGTPDCPMGTNVELDGAEWSAMARKAVKQAVLGSNNGDGKSLSEIVEQMAQRQHSWHTTSERRHYGGPHEDCTDMQRAKAEGDFTCLHMLKSLSRGIRALNL